MNNMMRDYVHAKVEEGEGEVWRKCDAESVMQKVWLLSK